MRIPRKLLLGCLTLALAACGSEAETAEAEAAPQPVASQTPLGEIPREEFYGASAAENLWSPRIELEALDLPGGWDGARFAILSDFQIGRWGENAEVAAAAVQRAIESQPELILLLGDYVAGGEDIPQLREVLAPLQGRQVFAVLGDRDIRSDSLAAQVTDALQSAGITVLQNRAAPVVIDGDTAWIAGLDPDLLSESGGDQEFILATLGPEGRTPLLLTHVPGLAARAPSGRYPIVVAGNTFCGDVEVPGTPRLSWVRDELFPGGEVEGVERLFRVRSQTVLITCGLGFGYVPIRFGAPPEVPILTLRSLGTDEDAAVLAPEMVEDSVIQRFQGAQEDSL